MPLSPALLVAEPPVATHLGSLVFVASAATHTGCVRKLNEDAWLERSRDGLWAVADGMGGHAAGDVAAQEVIRALEKVSDFSSAFAFRRNVRNALFRANATLQSMALRDMLDTVGSTAVALMAHGDHYACTWAGDSRAYLLRDDILTRVTTDHSVIQELIAKGAISESEAGAAYNANVVTRAVGAHPTLELDGVFGRFQTGDRFLLCTDGLVNVLEDSKIRDVLATGSSAQAVNALVAHALSLGAPDNVTCIVIDVSSRGHTRA